MPELSPPARRWLFVLVALCVLMALQGVSWMVLGSFDPWGIWDGLAAQELYGSAELPPEARQFARLVMIPFGATDAAFFALAALVLWRGVGRGQGWALEAFAWSFALWFMLDSLGCALLGAWFNVWLVNVPALVLVSVPYLFLRHAVRAC